MAGPGPVEALGLAKAFDGTIHLLITDAVPALLMPGCTEDALIRQGISNEEPHFLAKPISSSVLLSKVAQLIALANAQVALAPVVRSW